MFQKYKRIIIDVILNICATALPLAILQLVILPLLSRYIEDEPYGKMLTIISILTVVSGSMGNSLNNIRLVKNNNYEESSLKGDFGILVVSEMVIASFVVCGYTYHYGISFVDMILLFILAAAWTYREYAIVVFRIKLDFVGIVINNLVMILGYIVGLLIFLCIGYWEIIYIMGLLFSIVYINKKSEIARESLNKTVLFKDTLKDLIILLSASLLLNLLNYADRMIIYPMIGGTAVSIYYASTLFGKVISSAVTPINSVVLSYISKKDTMHRNVMYRLMVSTLLIAIVGYFVCRIVARPALSIMYPEWVDRSMEYVPIMTAVAMISMMSSVITPFTIKFCKMKWQLIINGSVLIVYLLSAIILYKYFGLMGFCVGVLASNIVKLVIVSILGIRLSSQEVEKK